MIGAQRLARALSVAVLVLVPSAGCGSDQRGGATASGRAAPVLHVAGNHFVDARGHVTRVFPVHFGTGEYTCVEPVYDASRRDGIFSGPTTSTPLAPVRSWHANALRVSLNEQCWLGVNPVRRGEGPRYLITPLAGAAARKAGTDLRERYRSAVREVVARAHRAGLAVIIDLHWSAAAHAIAYAQWPLPDRQFSLPFWRSVAETFRADRSVMFELFNEPVRIPAGGLSWSCLRDGCRTPNGCADCDPGVNIDVSGCGASCPTRRRPLGTYRSAGTQELVDAIRAAGARQPILVPGRFYANDLGRWLEYRPRDPLGQVAASFHVYEGLPCDREACWTRVVAPVAARVPVVATEFGGSPNAEREPCAGVARFDERFMTWADAHGVSYGGFRWRVDFAHFPRPQCSYDLLASYDGAPRYGQGTAIHAHLVRVAPP